MDVVFYYLRKKAKFSDSFQLTFTTTDNRFDQRIQLFYDKFLDRDRDLSLINRSDVIAKYIEGYSMLCNTQWVDVDYVFFPIYIKSLKHWVLGVLSLLDRSISVYDSAPNQVHAADVVNVVRSYADLLPLFMGCCGVFGKRPDLIYNDRYVDKTIMHPFDIIQIGGLPKQKEKYVLFF